MMSTFEMISERMDRSLCAVLGVFRSSRSHFNDVLFESFKHKNDIVSFNNTLNRSMKRVSLAICGVYYSKFIVTHRHIIIYTTLLSIQCFVDVSLSCDAHFRSFQIAYLISFSVRPSVIVLFASLPSEHLRRSLLKFSHLTALF